MVPQKSTDTILRLGELALPRPAVMGILNITPDSFSDGGYFDTLDAARHRAECMAEQGAAIIDVGGESTRPGAEAISETEEIDRVVPVIEAIRDICDVPVSVDTSKAGVMIAAVASGATMINDVLALRNDGALAAAAQLRVPVVLMHMLGEPRSMQSKPAYADVVAEVVSFLGDRVDECVNAGMTRDRIVIDPGFGFGKTHEHNVGLLANLRQLQIPGVAVLAGFSRKATLGALTGRDVGDRLAGSISAAVLAVMNGAEIIRAHDVAETVDALSVASAVMEAKQ